MKLEAIPRAGLLILSLEFPSLLLARLEKRHALRLIDDIFRVVKAVHDPSEYK